MYPHSDHFDGKRFYNLDHAVRGRKTFTEFLKWKLLTCAPFWKEVKEKGIVPKLPEKIQGDELFVTFINHASFLIQSKGQNILTDPVLSRRVGPHPRFGIKRVRPPGLTLDQMPKIDLVVISHNHYDHLDLPTLREIEDRDHPLFITPLGNGKTLLSVGITKIVELDWWETFEHVTLTPAQHWSARGMFDPCKALWGGFVFDLRFGKLFFAGDTGYNDHFKMIKERLGEMDLSILPIGAYAPRWFMKEQHMDPFDAVLAHQDLHSKMSIGCHFGTFQLTDEPIDEPGKKLIEALDQNGVPRDRFRVLEEGETFLTKKK